MQCNAAKRNTIKVALQYAIVIAAVQVSLNQWYNSTIYIQPNCGM